MTVQVPRDKGLDRTVSILKDGYEFIQKRVQNHHLDIYETKVLGEKVALISGESAAELFYDSELMKRNGAMPSRVLKTLFGEGGVQTLDGQAHAHRKQLFMSLMTPEGLERLYGITRKQWSEAATKWEKKGKITLFDEVLELLTRVACEWADVPLPEKEVSKRADDFNKMIEGATKLGPEYLASRRARSRTEKWIVKLIQDVRNGKREATPDSAIYRMAFHEDLEGNKLDEQIAAVELINILRPIVAISRYIVFGAHAFEEHTESRTLIKANEDHLRCFIQEVRRYYPFFPYLAAIAKKDFTWQQYDVKEGQLVMLDLYGTNHDPKVWSDPDEFRPSRFKDYQGSMYDLVPQGGGDHYSGHRCPGEWPTIEVLKASFSFMAAHLDYKVPRQDYSYSLKKIPSIPKSGFVMKKVRQV